MTTKIPAMLVLALAAALGPAHAAAPGSLPETGVAAQQVLASLTGLWTVRQSLWLEAGAPPQVDAGTALFTTVLGGKQLQQDLRVASVTPFQGLGYTSVDRATGHATTTWMDVNLDTTLVLSGTYDAASRTFRFAGEMASKDGHGVPTREELQVMGPDRLDVRFYETHGGREALVVELAYSRG